MGRVGWLLVIALFPGSVLAGTWEGRAGLELEYLGESYSSEQFLSAEDLGLPLGTSRLVVDTTRFHDDTWLPGPRLDFTWRREDAFAPSLELESSTAFNAEQFFQDLDFRGRFSTRGGRWRVRGHAGIREESRSLVGHGDWNTRLDASREQFLGETLALTMRVSWQHSRLRGDTTSYLYDYDRVRARATVRPRGWPAAWEGFLEGIRKAVPEGEPGAYREARVGGTWLRRDGGPQNLNVELRVRDYDRNGEVGRDLTEGDATGHLRLAGSDSSSWNLEGTLTVADYRGEDELYFDSGELAAALDWKRETGPWTIAVGPAVRWLRDLGGKDRGYRQWTGRGSGQRLLGAGFGELDLEAGFRDYEAGGSQVIEISSLSSSLVRSDYWLVDLFATWTQPVSGNVTLDFLSSFSWEFHGEGSERISVGFVTVNLTRRF